ncbi:MAG: transketolase [Eubacterium sp.]|nr:transketolase [Eubacterium sp.]MBQ6363439.1 transketolase [Lachnospiraceae bacterium]
MNNLRELAALLSVKEVDLRQDTIYQCETSIDRGLHVGGAFSALSSLTALYYGGFVDFDIENPTRPDQDVFVLSKGHAVAAMASVYADLGYISRDALAGSRGFGALVKGHPGPVIPGVNVATGPLGHGMSIACGYAMLRKERGYGNVYCMVGDGELQEGSCWEGIQLAAARGLNNLCVIVDKNNGQSDTHKYLSVGADAASQFAGFGYHVVEVYADEMDSMLAAFADFAAHKTHGKPTAVICNSSKGFGGGIGSTGTHKTVFSEADAAAEHRNQARIRAQLVRNLNKYDAAILDELAPATGQRIIRGEDGTVADVERIPSGKTPVKAPVRNKTLAYDPEALLAIEDGKTYTLFNILKNAMTVFAEDDRLYTIDSDLSNASGMYDGAYASNRPHAINVGIAECNMLCIAEAIASEGGNVFTSTFPPFFDERALRRIGVSFQERDEAIADGWLSEGHNLDITFVATSCNVETATNGATHMGNDDGHIVDQIAGIKVIDISCPRLLQSVLKWIAEGNKGLVYLRTIKAGLTPIYPADFRFEFGKALCAKEAADPKAVLVSSGHGVYEALAAAQILAESGIEVTVVDMPTEDPAAYAGFAASGIPVIFAEQNNGLILDRFGRYLVNSGIACDMKNIFKINLKRPDGSLQYIQSGTYSQIIEAYGLSPRQIAEYVQEILH